LVCSLRLQEGTFCAAPEFGSAPSASTTPKESRRWLKRRVPSEQLYRLAPRPARPIRLDSLSFGDRLRCVIRAWWAWTALALVLAQFGWHITGLLPGAFELMRQATPRLAMAADGGSLLSRVQRLLGMGNTIEAPRAMWIASGGILLTLFVASIAANLWAQNPGPETEGARVPASSAIRSRNTIVKKSSGSWLEDIQSAGYHNTDADELIRMKEAGVDGGYIREIRAAGLELNGDELVRFIEHGVTADYIDELKEAGLQGLNADEVIRLSEHGVEPSWINRIRALGYARMSADEIIRLNEHGITPELVRDAQEHGLKDISVDQIVRLAEHGILTP
jgi:hypothetical protein